MEKSEYRPTLLDISKKAKVSVNTAAKVLAGQAKNARISDKTAAKVKKIAKEAGYVPNLMARNLRSRRTGMIGVFVADMADSACVLISQLILKQLHHQGFSPIMTVAEIGPELCMREWLQNRIEGLIFCGTSDFITLDFLEEINSCGIVSLIAGCAFISSDNPKLGEKKISTISVNNYDGIEMVIKHLRERDKHKIVHICGPGWHGDAWERRKAYEAIISRQHEPIVVYPDSAKYFWQLGYKAMEQLRHSGTACDAVVAYDDQYAIGVIKWLTENKVQMPAQVAVVGFDDSPESQSCTPALTTIALPMEQIAVKAVSTIKNYLQTQPSVETIRIPPSLVIRESS